MKTDSYKPYCLE